MKRVTNIFLEVVMLFTMVSMSTIQAFAYLDFDFAESGCIGDYEERPEYAYNDPKNGTNVTYTFDKATGTLVVTHHPNVAASGKMASYSTSPFAGKAEIKHLIVNEGVTGFCNAAFKNCTGLVDVSLPSTITEIADNAFFNCTSLKSIELKNAVNGSIYTGNGEETVTRAVIDSREAGEGDVFFAMKGEKNDGHNFLEQVFASGCRMASV